MEHVKKEHVNSHSCLLGYDTMQSGMWAHRCRGTYRIHLCAHGVCPKHWNPPVTIQRVKTQTAASKNTQLHGLHIVCTEYHTTEWYLLFSVSYFLFQEANWNFWQL